MGALSRDERSRAGAGAHLVEHDVERAHLESKALLLLLFQHARDLIFFQIDLAQIISAEKAEDIGFELGLRAPVERNRGTRRILSTFFFLEIEQFKRYFRNLLSPLRSESK